MTVVAAIAEGGTVTMAADTVSQYQSTLIHGARKIRRITTADGQQCLIAASGNGAIAQVAPRLLKIDATPAPEADNTAWDEWAEVIASAATEILADLSPRLTTEQEGSTLIDGAFLLGAAGRLWYLFTHQALRIKDGIGVLGSGADLALGHLIATTHADLTPRLRVGRAVYAACQYDPWCSVDDDGPQVEQLPDA